MVNLESVRSVRPSKGDGGCIVTMNNGDTIVITEDFEAAEEIIILSKKEDMLRAIRFFEELVTSKLVDGINNATKAIEDVAMTIGEGNV